ncbi:hypothetical protein J5N97_023771 [Dioscorea zingiberensis]|uniref:Uncharacterized protein n=1 Tax=Dioscorea zingiberensis TaxID=325984 RepID=A0A9D5C685_9LILI|nr:hypothetical protein J5N97_023771 [Dioscorea zingiberensis]
MESMVEALSEAYDALVTASLDVVEARGASSGQCVEEADAALEEFKRRWELFKAACDEADQVVGSARLRLELETVADHHEKLNDCSAVAELSWVGLDNAIADIKRETEVIIMGL